MARGRAAGVIVCAATQKPAADVVPSALRDLFGFRLALRCNTPQASDTILGQGWASSGYNAASIAPGQRGVGLLLAEDGLPVRMRGFHLADEDVAAIAARASAARADRWLDEEGPARMNAPALLRRRRQPAVAITPKELLVRAGRIALWIALAVVLVRGLAAILSTEPASEPRWRRRGGARVAR